MQVLQLPKASQCYQLSHVKSRYFSVTRIQKDQVDDYADRKGMDLITTERWLAPILGYDV